MSTDIQLIDQAGVTARPTEDDGLGCLRTTRGNLPLESIDVRAKVTGLASQTELTQGFRNGYDEPLEATYVFPLPPRAAVTALRMEADGRVVEGVLKERGQARADYDQAIGEGKRASIAEEERPGVFTMRVGNILPGERVTVHLTLAGALAYEDGEATFRFPLVVAPKYIPGRPVDGEQVGDGTELDTDAVPDASRISPPVLLPGFPNPVRLSLEVDVDAAGLPITAVRSSLHATATEDTANGMRVRLNPGERADRDFLLRLRVGDEQAVSTSLAVLPDEDGQGGTFALTVLPPTGDVEKQARDVVLVLDRSGSMGGWKMVAARRAAARIVDTLTSADRFAVLAFDYQVDTPPGLPATLAEATDRNRFRAVEFLATLDARGGTEMLTPLRRAAALLDEAGPRNRVLVLVTDGQIGNEDQILHELSPTLGNVRVHTVGIDRAVNEGFLQRLAGPQGRCELVESEDRLDEAMQNIHRRIGTPLVTDLKIEDATLQVAPTTLAPTPMPDLYAGAPVVVMGRYNGTPDGAVKLAGTPDWHATAHAGRSDNPALAALWARANIRDLEDQYVTGQTALEDRIVATSLKYGVLSRFTAFIAVDHRVVTEGGTPRKITQPVDHPSGWELPTSAPMAVPRMAAAPSASMHTFSAGARTRGTARMESAVFGGADPSAPAPSPQAGAPTHGGGAQAEAPTHGGPPTGTPHYGGAPTDAPNPGSTPPQGGTPWRPPVAPPPSTKQPAPVPPGDTRSITEFATEELTRLRGNEHQDTQLKAGLLAALSERIRTQLTTWQSNNEPQDAILALGKLSTELATPATNASEVDQRWQVAVHTLESLTSGTTSRRRTFWKR